MSDKTPTLTQRMEKVEAAVGLRPKGIHAWTRDHWLALSISVGTVILIVIAILAWWQPQWKQQSDAASEATILRILEEKTRPLTELSSKMGERLAAMEKQVQGIDDNVKLLLKKELKLTASISPSDLGRNLDVVEAQLHAATLQEVVSDPSVINALQASFSKVSNDSVDYWPSAAAAITYISYMKSFAPKGISIRVKLRLPLCEPNAPAKREGLHFAMESNCILNLDGQDLSGRLYRDAIIVYHGGKVSLNNVQFVNCLFDFQMVAPPTKEGIKLTRDLLKSSDMSSLTVSTNG